MRNLFTPESLICRSFGTCTATSAPGYTKTISNLSPLGSNTQAGGPPNTPRRRASPFSPISTTSELASLAFASSLMARATPRRQHPSAIENCVMHLGTKDFAWSV
jgi:hypothetical protein